MIGRGSAIGTVGGQFVYTQVPTPPPPVPPTCLAGFCVEIDGTFTSQGWSADVSQNGVPYVGDVNASYSYTTWANPTAIYKDSDCSTPGAVLTGIVLESAGPVNGVTFSCTLTGDLQRDGVKLGTVLEGDCTFNSPSGSSTKRTIVVTQAELNAALCVDNPTDTFPTASCPTLGDAFVATQP